MPTAINEGIGMASLNLRVARGRPGPPDRDPGWTRDNCVPHYPTTAGSMGIVLKEGRPGSERGPERDTGGFDRDRPTE
eukprot:scaffold417_cov399-Pavlova_lutheri.AAC.1